jgi:hypothetical protein
MNLTRSALHPAAFVLLALLAACKASAPDPRADLARSLKGANVEGYQFTMKEDDAFVVTSLSNPQARTVMKLGDAQRTPLQYTRVFDRKANSQMLYRTDLVRDKSRLALVVTDLAKGTVVSRRDFPAPEDDGTPPPTPGTTGYDSIGQCIADFNCEHGGQLQCQANRTCQEQLAALTCCLKSGDCYSVHLVIKPTAPRCLLKDLVPPIEGVMLER